MNRALRARIMERCGGTCEGCGRVGDWRGGLQLHHIQHRKMGGSKLLDTESNLKALCARCHAKEHGILED